MNPLYSIVFIVLGWLLGLLSPHIIELISKPYRRSLIRESLLIELKDLRSNLAALAYLFVHQTGGLNREFIEWTQVMLGDKRNPGRELTAAEGLGGFLNFTDEQIQAVSHAVADPRRYLTIHRFAVPFLAAHVTSLSLFSAEFQRLALEIQASVGVINEHIDFLTFNFEKTFTAGLSERNHEALQTNMQTARMATAQRAREICDKITELAFLKK